MNYLDLTIEEMHEAIKNNLVTPKELAKEAVDRAFKYQEEYNSFVTILDDSIKDADNLDGNIDSPLYGIPYALKDNFSTKGILTTASSNILKDDVPFFDATIVEKLKSNNAICIGKTVLDELAMGGSGTTGNTGIVRNPWDKNRYIGGSSAGSAAAVALGIVPYAIGSDTGDSIRKPAAFGGLVGFKPTYGRISRFGLFPFACSLDHVGCFTRSVKDTAYVIDALKGEDYKDMTSLPNDNISYAKELTNDIKGKKLFYIKEIVDLDSATPEVLETLTNFHQVLDKCRDMGATVTEVSFDKQLLNAILPAYFTISCAEATSNNANLTGISFGPRGDGKSIEDMMFDARSKGFSELIKRRFIIGSYVLLKENQEKLFLYAGRIRRLIVDKMTELYKEYDALILPSSGGIAPLFGSDMDKLSDRYLLLENHMAIGNFGGFPSITIPSGFINNMPIAVNITGPILKDKEVLDIAYAIETSLGLKNIMAKGGIHNEL